MREYFIVTGTIVLLGIITGCSSIGHNEHYRIIQTPDQLIENGHPDFTLRNVYDRQGDFKPIRTGDPLNIIINNVWIADNSEDILEIYNQAEIGVVVSVYDGSQDDGRDYLVSYEKGINDNVSLPISDLLAYSTSNYQNQPIRITVTIFEFDQQENNLLSSILSKAASIGASGPANIGSVSLAAEVGETLLKSNSDDVIVKMSFQVYPWRDGVDVSKIRKVGVPRISTGSYIVINADDDEEFKELEEFKKSRAIYLNRALRPAVYTVENELAKKVKDLKLSHLVYTIDSTKTSGTKAILSKVDSVSRKSAGLMSDSSFSVDDANLILSNLESIKSNITLYKLLAQQNKLKQSPESLLLLWNEGLSTKSMLNEEDKLTLMQTIRGKIPPSMYANSACLDGVGAACKKEYEKMVKTNKLSYDSRKDIYLKKTVAVNYKAKDEEQTTLSGNNGEKN